MIEKRSEKERKKIEVSDCTPLLAQQVFNSKSGVHKVVRKGKVYCTSSRETTRTACCLSRAAGRLAVALGSRHVPEHS